MRPAWLIVALVLGCGPGTRGGPVIRPIGEDPIALLPSGADLVLDIDVEQLRDWPETRRILAFLPDPPRAFFLKALDDVDTLHVAIAGVGTPESRGTLLMRGRMDVERVRATFGGDSQETEYHGVTVVDGLKDSVARVMRDRVAVGEKVAVRRVVDLVRGEGESVRSLDHKLTKALERAPTAKLGRPAVMAAVVPPDALREQMRKEQLPGADLEWLAVSLALGDGFDVGAVMGTHGPKEATDLVVASRLQLRDFAGRPTVRALGFKPFLDPIIIKAREGDVHLAYRVPGGMVDRMLDRLESVLKPKRSIDE